MANAIVKYSGKAKTNSWARWLVGRTMRQNKNNLVSIVGKTGSGKTYTAISICEIMAEMDGVPFNIEHIVFSLTELMDLINSDELKKGSKIIFDEPQISIGAREFQSSANKVFNYLLTTFRHRNLTLFFCTPFESLLDKSSRKLFHGRFETMSINRNSNTCRIQPRFIEFADWKPEPYRKQLIVLCKEGESMNRIAHKVSYWDVPKPSKELIDKYELKKLEFTNLLNKNIAKQLEKYNDSGKSITSKEKEVTRKPLTEVQERVMKALANNHRNFDYVGEILGTSTQAVYKNKKLSEKKGYTIEEFEDDN